MKKYIVIIGLFFGVQLSGFGQGLKTERTVLKGIRKGFDLEYYTDSLYLSQIKGHEIKDLELPRIGTEGQFVAHQGFSLLYDEQHEQARWVVYQLTRAETVKLYKRTDQFIPDPTVTTGSATTEDYARSGYDRGHLAPAADMGWSATTTAESFYYSNMSPQVPSFNRGIWKKLETAVRKWAIETGAVYVVTGPILTNGLPTIGPDKVSVPGYYYKVVLEYNETGVKGIGFVLPNAGSKAPLLNYAVSIDTVEQLTGIDFFPLLEDDQETIIERTVCFKCWGLR